MKRIFALGFLILVSMISFAQSPEKMSYQAVIRDSANNLLKNQVVGMQISILNNLGSSSALYVETHTPSTNSNGLVSIQIGSGTIIGGDFSTIDWSTGPFFIKTETDPNGGTNYSISGTSQLLSVPYALYAKTAETLSGGISEVDPVFNSSLASGITSSDTAYWNNKLDTLSAGNGISIVGNTISATSNSAGANFSHYIGENFGGGVIFHLWRDSQGAEHGLIAALTDRSTSQVWSYVSNQGVGSTARSTWNGLSNSNAIIAQTGHTSSAAGICLNFNYSGFSDWYLPSADELSLMWQARFNLNKSLSAISGATELVLGSQYWSSTEHNATRAFVVGFNSGQAVSSGKTNLSRVRAIRAF